MPASYLEQTVLASITILQSQLQKAYQSSLNMHRVISVCCEASQLSGIDIGSIVTFQSQL